MLTVRKISDYHDCYEDTTFDPGRMMEQLLLDRDAAIRAIVL